MEGPAPLINEVKMHSYELANDVPPLDPTSLSVKESITGSTGNIPTDTKKRRHKIKKPSSDPAFPRKYDRCICPCPWPVLKSEPLVYVSFAPDSKDHEYDVNDLCSKCDKAGFTVKCDSYRALQDLGELNILQWRDLNFRRAACVLFCISPAYCDTIRSVEDGDLASAQESEHMKGVLYIYRLAQSELVDNCSIDRRFFIVLFRNSGNNLTVPLCFSPYTKFRFPEGSRGLISAMQHTTKHG